MSTTSRPPCIDLKATFGAKYRTAFEESYYAEKPEFRSQEAAWLTIIPCRHGHIYPFGGTKLAAWTDGWKRRRMLEALDCIEVHQDCDKEVTIIFDVDDFDRISDILIPRKRKYLTAEHKARLAESNLPYRFKTQTDGINDQKTDPGSDISANT